MVSVSDIYNFTMGRSAIAQLFQFVVFFWLVYYIMRAGKDMMSLV